ncbi:MAG TPA: hypothetical protein PLD20_00860 [Blastocatellia bacterium]|nr:hypothetical protein [Blastocatellia bacterium]HMV81797.1 hypothetical protein [Blastocatellia bacterium]HMX24022.1 hypothetical protein [Blastocatellia bacterium]HMY70696.1 hypothetical protein [Blastocatellia bacterium]HMZ16485.1 hypothetical protein [Blastocatellia bacterium]
MRANSARIKFEIWKREETVASLARKIGCRREELSMVIHGIRHYPEIRRALAKQLGLAANNKLLAYTAKSANRQAARKAA